MDPHDMKIVYVVGFAPALSERAAVGGFDWRPSWNEAAEILREHLSSGDADHDYVLRSMLVPSGLTDREVTEYLDQRLEMFEVPR